MILFYASQSSSQLQRIYYFLSKTHTKNKHSSGSDWWKYTKSCFKENKRTFFKNSTSQENIRISGVKKRLRNLYKKNENFKPEIKPTTENFQGFMN